ncbi:hypothetical protein ERUR111494_07415 [Erysipelothrix urinaevulpis]|uniref:hypothetical protein n=1 Tax=Erysipelothrix urinaevulpis TaxID=2683717 RepID=UPI001357FC23|nr:hypothetical protein [Erysipelothrix urinaevulpis]
MKKTLYAIGLVLSLVVFTLLKSGFIESAFFGGDAITISYFAYLKHTEQIMIYIANIILFSVFILSLFKELYTEYKRKK